jgi:acylphosphatase
VTTVGVHVVVSGRVQGVWYRQSCQERAQASGVTGWVRNLSDGTVEATLEGERPAVDALVAWMAEGPPSAVVEGLEVTDRQPSGATRFEVR